MQKVFPLAPHKEYVRSHHADEVHRHVAEGDVLSQPFQRAVVVVVAVAAAIRAPGPGPQQRVQEVALELHAELLRQELDVLEHVLVVGGPRALEHHQVEARLEQAAARGAGGRGPGAVHGAQHRGEVGRRQLVVQLHTAANVVSQTIAYTQKSDFLFGTQYIS